MTVTEHDTLTWTTGGVTYEAKARVRNTFDPDQPRDRKGRWIETGASVSIWGGGRGTVSRNLGGGYLEVRTGDGHNLRVHRNYLTVTQRPNGQEPSGLPSDRPRPLRASKPSAGVQDYTPARDTRVPVGELKPGQIALVYGHDQYGSGLSHLGVVRSVSEAGPPQNADTKPGKGWAVGFYNPRTARTTTVWMGEDAVARVVPDDDFTDLAEAERSGDEDAARRLANDIRARLLATDDDEASTPAPDVPAGSPAVEPNDRVELSNGAQGTVEKVGDGGALVVQLDDAGNRRGSRVNTNVSAVTPLGQRNVAPPADAPDDAPPAARQASGGPAAGTAADMRAGDRVTFEMPVTDASAARFSSGSNPPEVGDTVTVRGVLAADPEEDMFGGHTVRLADGARWETGRGIGPLADREFLLEEGHPVTKLGTGQARKPAPKPEPRTRQDGLFLEPDRAGTQEMFDPYAADFETVDAEPRRDAAPAAAPSRPDTGEAEPGGVEADIRAAYERLASQPGDWVGLARLRAELGDTGTDDARRREVDDVLRQMIHAPDVSLVPENNQKVLTAEQRAAALRRGDQDMHLIAIGDHDAIEASRAERSRNRAAEHTRRAQEAFDAGDYQGALDSMHEAEMADPFSVSGPEWEARRQEALQAVDASSRAHLADLTDEELEQRLADARRRLEALDGEEWERARDDIDDMVDEQDARTRNPRPAASEGAGQEPDGTTAPRQDDQPAPSPAASRPADSAPEQAPDPDATGTESPAGRNDFETRLAAASQGEMALYSTLNYQQVAMKAIMERRIRPREQENYRAAVRAYTTDDYVATNRPLYAARGGDLPADTPEEARDRIARLDLLMDLSTMNRDAVYYRGLREPQLLLDDPERWNPEGGNEGLEWTGHAFTSVSADESKAKRFTSDRPGTWGGDAQRFRGEDANYPTMFRILTPAGTHAIQISEMHVAGEVLLDRGLRYRVAADHGVVDGVHRLDVEVVGATEPKRLPKPSDRPKTVPGDTPPAGVAARNRGDEPGSRERAPCAQGEPDASVERPQVQPGPQRSAAPDTEAATSPAADLGGAPATEAPPAAADRPAPPEGQAYADEIVVGDTLAEARYAGTAGPDRVMRGSTVYANPAGPARLGGPNRESRRVTDIESFPDGRVKFVFDDGTSITRVADQLVVRGEPADVIEDGRHVGEWVPSRAITAGDRVRYETGTPQLPSRLDREKAGLKRTWGITVEGRVVRRQPGQPTAVLTDVVVTRADGTRVPIDEEYAWRLPNRVVRLDESAPSPTPEMVTPGELHEGDRITGPDGSEVQVDEVDRGGDVALAVVRDDDDRRTVRALDAAQPVRLAPDTPPPSGEDIEARDLSVGDWVLLDGATARVASPPVEEGERTRFDVADSDGVREVEVDRRVLLTRLTPPTGEVTAEQAVPQPPVLVAADPLPDGVPAGRVRLRTDQRRRLLELNLDAADADVPPPVRQAAARLRARQEMTGEEMRGLADHLRALSVDETQPGARRRSLARTASWVDAAYARLEGFPAPPHDPGRDAPEKAHARNLTMGDVIALPDGDGNVGFGTVTVVRPIRGFGLVAVHVRRPDGSVEQRVLPDRVDLWVMPDLPPDRPAPPSPSVREHIRVSRLTVGDEITVRDELLGADAAGTVTAVARTSRPLDAVEWYDVTLRDAEGGERTVSLADRGWPAVVRTGRGPSSQEQPYDAVMAAESPQEVAWRDLAVGDRVRVDDVTGTITAVSRTRDEAGGQGATLTLLDDAGEQRSIPLTDPADGEEAGRVVRLVAADANASARIREEARRREQITQERRFTAFLADTERDTNRRAADGIASLMEALPPTSSRDDAVAAATQHLDQVQARGGGEAGALAWRLGAADAVQQAGLETSTRLIADGVRRRATDRIRTALDEVDLLPGETWPDAVARVAAAYRDHPPAQGVIPAGQALAALRTRLRAAGTPDAVDRPQPALPDGADLPARLAAYRAALPDDLADLGRHPVQRATFAPTSLEELEAGTVPEVRVATLWADDVAADDGPGEQAMAHLAALRAAGRDVDARYRHHLAGRDAAVAAELEAVVRRRGAAWQRLDDLDSQIVARRRAGRDEAARTAGYADFTAYRAAAPEEADAAAARVEQTIPSEVIQQRDVASREWQQHATREAELRGMLATARRDALAATLAEIRPIGGEGLIYTDRSGKAMTGRAGSNAAALRYAEQVLPADWLAAARALGPVEVVTGPGRHVHGDGRARIGLPADDDTALAYRDGAQVRVPVPSSQPGGVPKAGVAAHELAHHMEVAVPGLVEAERLLHYDRTSHGDVGSRTLPDPVTGADRGQPFTAYPGDFPHPYTGRVYRDGEAYEVFASVMESLAGGRDTADDDLRHWGFGVLALLGTPKNGPSGGTPAATRAEGRDPLDSITLNALTDEQLRALLARIDDPAAQARIRAELDGRTTPDTTRVDVSSLSEAELLALLEKGWAKYGEDTEVTALQDHVIAELEARETDQRRRGLDGVTESDLATMDTDDLAELLTRNWPRYDNEPAVAAMLDQVMAELDGRDRARAADAGDPYAGVDLATLPDEELEALRAQHEASYHSDPASARLTKRIFAEMDARDLAAATAAEDASNETDRRIDDLIAQGWTPRDAYAEVHGLDAEEMERAERRALIDAERQRGERREDTVRRMYTQWVHEQWLDAEQATRGYLLNRAGVAANVDPKSLWGGNQARAAKYASEELRRWWSEQPNGGRMTYAEWRAQWLGDQADRRAARERRTSSTGRDFGV